MIKIYTKGIKKAGIFTNTCRIWHIVVRLFRILENVLHQAFTQGVNLTAHGFVVGRL